MKKILVIGSLNLDMVTNVDHMPAVGETILCPSMQLIPGGKGANQACAAASLGADTTILGAVGADSYAELLKESLCRAGADVSHLIVRPDQNTGVALITVNRDGDNSIVVVSGANAAIHPEDIEKNRPLLEACDMVVLQMEIPLETVLYSARLAKQLGKTVLLDPAPVPKVFPKELLQYVDILKPNETELSMLTGIDITDKDTGESHLEEAAAWVHSHGCPHLVVTLGEKGVYLHSDVDGTPENCRIPARNVHAVDTTAAGDTFTAALAVRLLERASLKDAALFANCASSIVVTRKGAQSSIPTREEVEEIF